MGMADFRSGNPTFVDFTPGAAVAVGDVVVTNDTPRVAHLPIANGDLGALATEGGIYRMVGDGIIAADKKVYWDAAAQKVSLTAGSNKIFGVTVTACGGNGQTCEVRHDPGA